METCVKCKRELPSSSFSPSVLTHRLVLRCRECAQANKKRKKKIERGNLTCVRCSAPIEFGSYRRIYCSELCSRRAVVLRAYGLPPHADLEMLGHQQGACASCGDELGADMNVDHCHETGRVRALLCSPCNLALGATKEDQERQFMLGVYTARHQFDLRDLCGVA